MSGARRCMASIKLRWTVSRANSNLTRSFNCGCSVASFGVKSSYHLLIVPLNVVIQNGNRANVNKRKAKEENVRQHQSDLEINKIAKLIDSSAWPTLGHLSRLGMSTAVVESSAKSISSTFSWRSAHGIIFFQNKDRFQMTNYCDKIYWMWIKSEVDLIQAVLTHGLQQPAKSFGRKVGLAQNESLQWKHSTGNHPTATTGANTGAGDSTLYFILRRVKIRKIEKVETWK